MNTLPDVDTRQGETKPCDIGFTSDVIPEAKSSNTGVSVKYAFHENKKWFVLRATYGRTIKACEIIQKDGYEVYIPMGYQLKNINGKKQRVKTVLLPNIIFVYSTEEYIVWLTHHPVYKSFINLYLNHFSVNKYGNNPPLTVRYNDMINFINLTSIDNEYIRVVDAAQCRFKNGDLVRVIDGDFKGIVGRVARTAGEQRVVVEIEGICLIATAYIPTAFLMKESI